MKPQSLATFTLCALFAATGLAPDSAHAQSAQAQRAQKTAEIPTCARSLGTLAVLEPETNWWSSYQLSSPAALIKVFVSKSRCFTVGPIDAIGTGPVVVSGDRVVVRGAATGWWPVPAARGRLGAGHGNPEGRA
jgi:hypothetical protein